MLSLIFQRMIVTSFIASSASMLLLLSHEVHLRPGKKHSSTILYYFNNNLYKFHFTRRFSSNFLQKKKLKKIITKSRIRNQTKKTYSYMHFSFVILLHLNHFSSYFSMYFMLFIALIAFSSFRFFSFSHQWLSFF